MALISFNNHYPDPVDHDWKGNLPIKPDICFKAVHRWLGRLDLDRNTIHTIAMPGVRGAVIIGAYHTLLGHFPHMLFSRREGDGWTWDEIRLQEVREVYRAKRY